MRMKPIDVRHVKVGGEIGRRIDITARNNVLVIDIDKDFLSPFRDRSREEGYIGLGKLIDSVVRLAAYMDDDEVLSCKDRIVKEVIQTQEPDGYIGIMRPEKRVESLWDVHEMSYLIYGLTSNYRFFREEASLKAAGRLGDYLLQRWTHEPKKIPGSTALSTLGIENAMLSLYEHTNDQKYIDFCTKLCGLQEWDAPIVLGRWGRIEGQIYNYLHRCLAQLQLHSLQPDPRLLQPTRRAFDFMTRRDGMTITGLLGDHECWHDTQEGLINLGETCATAYLSRFLNKLLQREGLSFYGDLMERAIYNGLFAAQSPDGRKIRYYTPFDGPRCYHDLDTYCCPNNYRRIVSELPCMIYYQPSEGLVINLYTSSRAEIALSGGNSLSVRQDTEYPRSGEVVVHVNPSRPARFPLWLRIPRWCKGPTVEVNHLPVDEAVKSGDFLRIDRIWRAGDQVLLSLPMPLRWVRGRKAQAGRAAIMRGPQVFCLNRANHPKLAGMDLRLLVIDPESLEGPLEDESVRPGGQMCRLRAWSPGKWYPHEKTDLSLELTEFADPGGEAIYFKVPNPDVATLVADELLQAISL